jgi:hypothetical protein
MAEKVKKAKAPAARKTTAKNKTADPRPIAVADPQPVSSPRPVSHDQIRQLAHRYWAERGQPNGQPDVDWFRAEQELRGKAS